MGEKVSVSQSSSVSKVSVKMGSVSVSGRDTKEVRGERRLDAGSNQLEADVRQSFFQQLLDRLQDLADVRIEEEKGEIEMNTERLVYDEGEEEIPAEVLIDRSKVELLTFRNKIGIFIGVVMIVLTISVVLGMISVSIRRARRGKRMMKEDELSQADTVSTVMETSSYSGLPDSFYSNYIRKSSLSCDEL